MMLYQYQWDLEGGKTIKKIKQFYKDLFNSSAEEYWKDEGNNKRMQFYHKLSIIMKYLKVVLIFLIIIYCLYLSTNTIFSIFDNFNCLNNNTNLIKLIDLRKFVLNTYIITFVIMMFLVVYYGKKNNLNCKNIINTLIKSILFLPCSALLNYNFMILGSLMRSFYLVVVVAVIILSIDYILKKINRLYDLAVNETAVNIVVNKNGKGDNRKCKKK